MNDTVDGLSAKTMAQIRRIEVLHPLLHPGATREALRTWEEYARSLSTWTMLEALRGEAVIGCGIPECCPTPVEDREPLSVVLHALRRPQARDLRARVGQADALHGFPDHGFPPA
ncbi:hypothetical protein O4J56_26815 [Nocardiopsis sp. RSe5-2]|uniref:Uncharacterized protein n=1 Tax=Nocardiopsis endophytica TaxID=3018445 RepID=A0ABT4UBI4_9ACTN|nr:hypothetical protein [Nocardiopsis endophytica]MDA2814290.1 hypothetical protein [Nocardiopsis endophytica]